MILAGAGVSHDDAESPNVYFGWLRPSKTPPKFNEKTPRESTKSEILGGGRKKKRARFWAVQRKGGPEGPSSGGRSSRGGPAEDGPVKGGPAEGGPAEGGPAEENGGTSSGYFVTGLVSSMIQLRSGWTKQRMHLENLGSGPGSQRDGQSVVL